MGSSKNLYYVHPRALSSCKSSALSARVNGPWKENGASGPIDFFCKMADKNIASVHHGDDSTAKELGRSKLLRSIRIKFVSFDFPGCDSFVLRDTIPEVFQIRSTGLSVALELILGVLALSVLRFFENTLEKILGFSPLLQYSRGARYIPLLCVSRVYSMTPGNVKG